MAYSYVPVSREPITEATNPWFRSLFTLLFMSTVFTLLVMLAFKQSQSLIPFVLENASRDVQFFSASENAFGAGISGRRLGLSDQLRTGADGEAVLSHPHGLMIRAGNSTAVEFRKPQAFRTNWIANRAHLLHGTLYLSMKDMGYHKTFQVTIPGFEKTIESPGGSAMEFGSPKLIAEMISAEALIQYDPRVEKVRILVLDGEIKIMGFEPGKFLMLREGYKIEISGKDFPSEGSKIPMQERFKLKAEQVQYQKPALSGNRSREKYQNIIDLNAKCDVYKSARDITANCEYLERKYPEGRVFHLSYDLSLPQSFAGLSFWPRFEDISQAEALTIEIMADGEAPLPARLHVELISGDSVVRVFTLKNLDQELQSFVYPIQMEKSRQLTRVNVFARSETAGDFKQGAFAVSVLELTAKNS